LSAQSVAATFEDARRLDRAVKRSIDILCSLTLLILLAPLCVLVAIAIKLDSPGPVFYRCRRVGYRGREFAMLKFRKMRNDADGSALTAAGDVRFTRIGRVLAATKLDELPQLINVLSGSMSLVGPRPEDPQFVDLYRFEYEAIVSVRPGVTGLCQLAFAKESDVLGSDDPESVYLDRLLPQKVGLDLLYVERRSVLFDFRIVVWTILAVALRRDVAVHRTTGGLSLRRRPVRAGSDRLVPEPVRRNEARSVASLHIVPDERKGTPNADTAGTSTRAVILAGGRGTRLAPYTSVLPKPLMPIGDQSILGIVVGQLAGHGIRDVTLCVGYLSHLIRAVCDHIGYLGARITYVHEEEALGTAGPLHLIDDLDSTFLVMNGDVLTKLDYRTLVQKHKESGNILTVATRQRTIKVDYGVLQLGGSVNGNGVKHVESWEEKPEVVSYVSMGIYVLEPGALEYVPAGVRFDVPELVHALLEAGEQVGAYTYDGAWFDIGRQSDYAEAVSAWSESADEASPANAVAASRAR
jgi:NDP-mannose synthase